MLYLSGVVRPDMPAMLSLGMGNRVPAGQLWAADNGRFNNPAAYSDDAYVRFLARHSHARTRCLFATAPDVVGDATATLELSGPMFPRIHGAGYLVALVAQDGLTSGMVPWSQIDALFVGGTTAWKLSEDAYGLAREAKSRGKWTHMGRVNSWRRFRAAAAAGYDSADGTALRFDPQRPVASWSERAIAQKGLRL